MSIRHTLARVESQEVDGEFIKFKSKPKFVLSVRQDNPMDGADLILWSVAGMNDKWTFDGRAKDDLWRIYEIKRRSNYSCKKTANMLLLL